MRNRTHNYPNSPKKNRWEDSGSQKTKTNTRESSGVKDSDQEEFWIFISNLTETTRVEDVIELFSQFAEILHCELPMLRLDQCRGFCKLYIKPKYRSVDMKQITRRDRESNIFESIRAEFIRRLRKMKLKLHGRLLSLEEYVFSQDSLLEKELEKALKRVCVLGIPKKMSEEYIEGLLRRFGEIDHFYIRQNKRNRKNFGFATFILQSSAELAVRFRKVEAPEFSTVLTIKKFKSKLDPSLIESMKNSKQEFRHHHQSSSEDQNFEDFAQKDHYDQNNRRSYHTNGLSKVEPVYASSSQNFGQESNPGTWDQNWEVYEKRKKDSSGYEQISIESQKKNKNNQKNQFLRDSFEGRENSMKQSWDQSWSPPSWKSPYHPYFEPDSQQNHSSFQPQNKFYVKKQKNGFATPTQKNQGIFQKRDHPQTVGAHAYDQNYFQAYASNTNNYTSRHDQNRQMNGRPGHPRFDLGDFQHHRPNCQCSTNTPKSINSRAENQVNPDLSFPQAYDLQNRYWWRNNSNNEGQINQFHNENQIHIQSSDPTFLAPRRQDWRQEPPEESASQEDEFEVHLSLSNSAHHSSLSFSSEDSIPRLKEAVQSSRIKKVQLNHNRSNIFFKKDFSKNSQNHQ